jgi:peptide chain release factor 2
MMRERTRLATSIDAVRRIETELGDTVDLVAMAEAEDDAGMVAESVAALKRLAEEAKLREIESLLSGEADGNDCYMEINAGAGGTEAQDWAEMLERMYMRWAEKHGYKIEIMDTSEGEQAGIKSATLMVTGPSAYGWLKTEAGVHRLLRLRGSAADELRQCLRLSRGRRHDRDRDQPGRSEGRYLPGLGGGRPARQQDGKRHPHHPCPFGNHCCLPDRP